MRLFPSSAPPDLAHREAAVQTVVTEQGYPGAGVLLFDEEARLLGRRYFIVERLPGGPMMGGILQCVAAYRLAEAKGEPHDVPRFTWVRSLTRWSTTSGSGLASPSGCHRALS